MPPKMADAEHHPAFGLMTFTKVNHSTREALFGSSIEHSHTIMLEVRQASHYRNRSQDVYASGELLITIKMSPSQFADAITNMNHSNGTPVTVRFLQGDITQRPEPPTENRAETFVLEYQDSIQDTMDMVDDLISHPKLPAAARRKAEHIKSRLSSSTPFLEKQFAKQMERTITEAKAEIQAYTSTVERTQQNAITEPVADQ